MSIQHLRQSLAWIAVVAALVGVVFLLAGVAYDDQASRINAGILAGYVLLLLALRPLRRPGVVALVVAATTMVAAAVMATLQPFLAANLFLSPLLVVILCLAYVDGLALRVLCVVAFLDTVGILIAGQVVQRPSRLPELATVIAASGAAVATIGVSFRLLWLHHTRLSLLVAELRAQNAALRASQQSLRQTSEALSDAHTDLWLERQQRPPPPQL